MFKSKLTYILLILCLLAVACKQTKFVPEGRYLLKKNEVVRVGDKVDKDELNSIIRQQANYKSFGIKWKLTAFNLIDSTKVANKRARKNIELRAKNRKKIARQDRINSKRMEKALRKGNAYYTEKIIPLKDTITPSKFLREWYKYEIGRPPVIFDSILYNKSLVQLAAYLKRKGYYYGTVNGVIEYKKNRKCIARYLLLTGEQYRIDSVYVVADNPVVRDNYEKLINRKQDHPLIGTAFDVDLLDDFRYEVAKFMRNEALYGFSSSNISFMADTNKTDMSVTLGIQFGDRYLKSSENRDSIIQLKHQVTIINNVYFHISDTLNYEGSFTEKMVSLGLPIYDGPFLRTLDTTFYANVKLQRSDHVDISRTAIFLHNGPLSIKPRILESKNYLEMDQKYSEKKLERTYLSLLQMELFEAVKTELEEIDASGCVDAHYYLLPSKKQSFSFEPTATNTNGFLGVAATVSYTSRNLFGGAENLTMSLSGGFESQPPVFDKTEDGEPIQTASRSFNTFEIGPSTQLELPGLFPFRLSNISKRLRPKTIVSVAYNFQHRDDFTSGTMQLNYFWQFFASKTMIFKSGFPGASVVKFVKFYDRGEEFESKLVELNDLFLLNAYSDQFIWQDWKFTFEYNIKEKEHRRGNSQLDFYSTFDPAGNILSLFKKYQDTVNGQHAIAGIGYSQFLRLDNELIYSKPLRKERSLNFRFAVGGGIPYGNTKTSLPYDYSFFAGGANDNRGWRARSLGPGSYKYYLDTNRTATQLGDFRLGASAEFRFTFNNLFKGALFVDAGNVWTIFEDVNRAGGQLSENWHKEIALAAGIGLRMDLEYFIIRVDLGFPIMNPALPESSKWIFQSREAYYQEGIDAFGIDNYESLLPLPFIPTFHFGIGYPF